MNVAAEKLFVMVEKLDVKREVASARREVGFVTVFFRNTDRDVENGVLYCNCTELPERYRKSCMIDVGYRQCWM